MSKVKVLFVCLGNICRSPLAEAIFKDKIRRKNLEEHFEVDSCGTSNYHIGVMPDSRTIANAGRHGIKLDHFGRQLTLRDLEDFDYIIAMDSSNHRNILRLSTNGTHAGKVLLLREYDSVGKGSEVPDPYYGAEHDFQEVFEILDRSTHNFLLHIEETILKKKL